MEVFVLNKDSTFVDNKSNVSPNVRNMDYKTYVMSVKFARDENSCYVAHLDMMRIFERSVRRAGIDCDYTQGFNPRPVMTFALPLGVGVESIDDYAHITLKKKINPGEFVEKMNRSLPHGIKILGAEEITESKKSLMARVCACEYLFLYKGIGRFKDIILSTENLPVTKTSKGKKRVINIKDYVLSVDSPDENSLSVMVKAGSKENLRPDLFLASLTGKSDFTGNDALDTRIVRKKTIFEDD
jgi:radical SAM-linked protein